MNVYKAKDKQLGLGPNTMPGLSNPLINMWLFGFKWQNKLSWVAMCMKDFF
jgi:hypothetical protein